MCPGKEKASKKRNSKPRGPEYDYIYNLGADAYPETGVYHVSPNCYAFSKFLHKERFTFAAHPGISESDELIFKIHQPAFAAVSRLP